MQHAAHAHGLRRRRPAAPGMIAGRHSAVFVVAVVVGALGCGDVNTAPEPPQADTGFAGLLEAFAEQHNIGAAALGVMRSGNMIYEGVTGFMDAERSTPVVRDVIMRIASVTKPITAAAIRQLAADGLLALDDRAFDLGQQGGGLLALDPFPALGDPRLEEITILHLLQHRGGWDREITVDWVFREIRIAEAMSVPSPPGRENTVRYVLGQPLQFDPGSRSAYSNVGYLVLGLIVEEVSGQDYLTYVRENIFAPLGVPAGDVIRGRTFPEDRSEREPWYDAEGLGRNVFAPSGPLVRRPDGGWDLEAKIGEAGLVASTRALLAFLEEYMVWGEDIGSRRSGVGGGGWWRYHSGTLSGTNALAYQHGSGISYAILFNRRAPVSDQSYLVKQFMGILNARLAIPGG